MVKVYLQYPWKFPDSPYYKYLIDSPPKDIKYLNVEKQKGVITNKKAFWFSNFLKRNIRKWTKKFNVAVPNAHLSPKGDYNLIHCAHCLSKNKNIPWVADIEGFWQLYVGKRNNKVKKQIKKILLNDNCKKIMPWTEATKQDILKEFPEIENKIEVVYPAIPTQEIQRVPSEKINLVFVGRYFEGKGGLDALKAIDFLTKKYENVYANFISQTPKEILKEYSGNKKIKFYELMPQNELFEILSKTDILIYPGYSDSFGFIFLEAMSFGIPIITVEGLSKKEIINDKIGFIVPKENVVNNLISMGELLIENKELRDEMSENCLKKIEEGKFSIKERNEKLKRIYEEALK